MSSPIVSFSMTGVVPCKAVWVGPEQESHVNSILEYVRGFGMCGYDTEFYGVDVSSESCVGKAIVDVFSISVLSGDKTALGFRKPESWVFDGALLQHPAVKSFLEDPSVVKPIHNQPVDSHSTANHGVFIKGGVNTLAMARWLYPERANTFRGFDLDALCRWRIGYGKTEDFDELFGYDEQEAYECDTEKNFCLVCESFDCRKKKGHEKERRPTKVIRHKKVRRHIPLNTVRPGHVLFDRYRIYSAADAELAAILYVMMLEDGAKQERWYPWGL